MKTSSCELKVLKPFMFEKGSKESFNGQLNHSTEREENTVRRLGVGRAMKIGEIYQNNMYMRDRAIYAGCIVSASRTEVCVDLTKMTIAEIEAKSVDSISIECTKEVIKDI